ncbi:hypothetical protein [Hippea sp. KM1]|uniref:hypothetical protein n=1 Tax=Hippea sp. KM1 TaxID=944481 RepID=UPI00046CE8F2|nr:hypothetical protein [Hippea sp. KM1]
MSVWLYCFLIGLSNSVNVIREGYEPHVSIVDRIILGVFTFIIVFAVLFVRYRVSKELKKRGIKGEPFRRRKKTDKR